MIGRMPGNSNRPQQSSRAPSNFSTGVPVRGDASTPANAEDVEAELLALARQARSQQPTPAQPVPPRHQPQYQPHHSRQLTMEDIEEQLRAQAQLQLQQRIRQEQLELEEQLRFQAQQQQQQQQQRLRHEQHVFEQSRMRHEQRDLQEQLRIQALQQDRQQQLEFRQQQQQQQQHQQQQLEEQELLMLQHLQQQELLHQQQRQEQHLREQLVLHQQLLQQQQVSSAAALAQAQQAQQRGQHHSRTLSEQTQQHMFVQAQMQEQLQMLRQRHVQQQNVVAAQAVQAQAAAFQVQQDPTILTLDPDARAALMHEAARKIQQTEQLEERRRRRVIKMQRMSKYNELMTQGDKDFITRIQVSQLVSADPFLDDYYAQVFRQRLGMNSNGDNVLKLGAGGVGLGMPNNRAGRRENALQRMQQQVERLVKLRLQAEKEKGTHGACSPRRCS